MTELSQHNRPGELGDGSPMTVDELKADPHLDAIRWAIMLAIATRCGQIPDIHPRLVDGVNAAARLIARDTRPAEPGAST